MKDDHSRQCFFSLSPINYHILIFFLKICAFLEYEVIKSSISNEVGRSRVFFPQISCFPPPSSHCLFSSHFLGISPSLCLSLSLFATFYLLSLLFLSPLFYSLSPSSPPSLSSVCCSLHLSSLPPPLPLVFRLSPSLSSLPLSSSFKSTQLSPFNRAIERAALRLPRSLCGSGSDGHDGRGRTKHGAPEPAAV